MAKQICISIQHCACLFLHKWILDTVGPTASLTPFRIGQYFDFVTVNIEKAASHKYIAQNVRSVTEAIWELLETLSQYHTWSHWIMVSTKPKSAARNAILKIKLSHIKWSKARSFLPIPPRGVSQSRKLGANVETLSFIAAVAQIGDDLFSAGSSGTVWCHTQSEVWVSHSERGCMMAHDAAPMGASRSTSLCGSIAFTVA